MAANTQLRLVVPTAEKQTVAPGMAHRRPNASLRSRKDLKADGRTSSAGARACAREIIEEFPPNIPPTQADFYSRQLHLDIARARRRTDNVNLGRKMHGVICINR